MPFISIFSPRSMNLAQYSAAMKCLEVAGAKSPEGRLIHVCYGDEPQLKIMTVWQSRDDFQAMAPTLLPILKDAGIEVGGPPEIFQVHDIEPK